MIRKGDHSPPWTRHGWELGDAAVCQRCRRREVGSIGETSPLCRHCGGPTRSRHVWVKAGKQGKFRIREWRNVPTRRSK